MPIKVRDNRTGKVVEVSGQQAQQGLADGSLALADERVNIMRAGQVGSVPSDNVDEALGMGFEIVDRGQVEAIEQRMEAESTLGQIRGATEAALAGASFGISDWTAANVLGADPEMMRLRREGLGSVGVAAELAGAIAPAFFSGGATLEPTLARLGARALSAPVRGVETLGLGAEALTGRGLARLGVGEGLARSAIPVGVRGATEGVFYGMGVELSEATLGQRDITAERLAAAGGMGMALGLGGGAIFGSLGRIAANRAPVSKDSLAHILARVADGTVDSTHPVVRTIAAIQGTTPDDLVKAYRKIRTGEAADYFYRPEVKADEIRHAARENINGLNADFDEAIKATSGERKLRRLASMVPESSDIRAPWRLADELDELNARLTKAEVENRIADGGAYEYHALKAARGALGKAMLDIGKAKTGVEAFRIAERAKQEIGFFARKLQQVPLRMRTPKLQASIELLEGGENAVGINRVLKDYLTDERLFGEAARAQKVITAADAHALSFAREHSGGGTVGKILRGEEIDAREAMLFVKKWGRAGSESLEEATDAYFRAQLNSLRKRGEFYDLSPQELATIKRAEKRFENFEKTMEKQREQVDTYDLFQRLRHAEGGGSPSITMLSTIGPALAGTIGSAFGPAGAAVGFLAGSLTRPYTVLRTVAGIHDIATKAGLRIDKAVNKFVGGFQQKLTPEPTRTIPKPKPISTAARGGAVRSVMSMGAQERREKLEEVRERAVMLASSPHILQETLADALQDIDKVSPGVAEAMQQVTARGAAYLAEHAPRGYVQPWSGRPPVISNVELSAFARRVEATAYPIEVLEERLANDSLMAEHVDALKNVWPQIFDGVRASIGQAVMQAQISGKAIPARKRSTLGRLFEVPIGPGADVTLDAAMMVWGDAAPPPEAPQTMPANRPRNVAYDTGIVGVYTAGGRADRGLKG